MKKNILIVLIIIVIAIVFFGFFIKDRQPAAPVIETETMVDESVVVDDAMAKTGSYEAYAPEKLAKAETGKVVLFFRASWCPTCRALDANIKSNLKNIPADLTILDVNYDDSTALRQKYGVTVQHTLVQVDANGQMLAKWTSSQTLAPLIEKVK